MPLRDLFHRFNEHLGIRKQRFLLQVPPTVKILLENRHRLRSIQVPNPKPDEPLAALYRIYVTIVGADTIWMRNEIEAFWSHHQWRVSEIPDPKDPDPQRYALLATIPYLLVRAFNANINLGLPRDAPAIFTLEEEMEFRSRPKKLEHAPAWADKVPPLDTQLFLTDDLGHCLNSVDDPRADQDLARKNIVMTRLGISFI